MNYVEQDLVWKAQIEALITMRCAYEAENTARALSNFSPAYGPEHFFEIEAGLTSIANEIKEGRQ
jgi:hypothetical protein